MQKITLLFFVVISLGIFSCDGSLGSCGFNNCGCIDCIGSTSYILKFLSKTDSTDLLAGGGILADSLRIFKLKDRKNEPYNWLLHTTSPGMSPYIELEQDVHAYIFYYSVNESDTLFLQTHKAPPGTCCGGNTILEVALFNGDTIGSSETQSGSVMRLFK